MSSAEFQHLAEVSVLAALREIERKAFDQHLTARPARTREIVVLLADISAYPPPPELRRRLLAAIAN